jgi:hypothetical protein
MSDTPCTGPDCPLCELGHTPTSKMFGPKPGTWYVSSKSDPRWDANGRTEQMLFSVGTPPELDKHLAQKMKELGDPPDDLEWEGMKD